MKIPSIPNQAPEMVRIPLNDLHQLQSIVEAAARVAEELGHTHGAANIRATNGRIDERLDQDSSTWDRYGSAREWLSEIKHGANNPITHP